MRSINEMTGQAKEGEQASKGEGLMLGNKEEIKFDFDEFMKLYKVT